MVDLEGALLRARERTSCVGEVDLALAGARERAALLLSEDDRQQPDLRAVRVEDVGEARRRRSPGSRSPAGPTERARGEEPQPKFSPVTRIGLARQVPAVLLGPVEEEELAEAGALDALEELLGHDLVGVDVGAVELADRPWMTW